MFCRAFALSRTPDAWTDVGVAREQCRAVGRVHNDVAVVLHLQVCTRVTVRVGGVERNAAGIDHGVPVGLHLELEAPVRRPEHVAADHLGAGSHREGRGGGRGRSALGSFSRWVCWLDVVVSSAECVVELDGGSSSSVRFLGQEVEGRGSLFDAPTSEVALPLRCVRAGGVDCLHAGLG